MRMSASATNRQVRRREEKQQRCNGRSSVSQARYVLDYVAILVDPHREVISRIVGNTIFRVVVVTPASPDFRCFIVPQLAHSESFHEFMLHDREDLLFGDLLAGFVSTGRNEGAANRSHSNCKQQSANLVHFVPPLADKQLQYQSADE
jgi:hypothetical protein